MEEKQGTKIILNGQHCVSPVLSIGVFMMNTSLNVCFWVADIMMRGDCLPLKGLSCVCCESQM